MKKYLIILLTFMSFLLMGVGTLIDNIHINGNTIEAIDTNGNLTIKANGTGSLINTSDVRIGATTVGTAGAELDVVGDSIFSGQLTVGASTLPSSGYGLDVTGDSFLSGTLSVNKSTLIGAGLEFEVNGDSVISSTLSVGSSTSPTSGVEFEITGDQQMSGSLGIGTTVGADANAILDINSTTKATYFRPLTTGQRDAIPSPQDGFFIYNTTMKAPNIFDGTSWLNLLTSANVVVSTSTTSRIETAEVICSSSSSITQENGNWLDSITNVSAGLCSITITSGIFSAAPICVANSGSAPVSQGIIISSNATLNTNLDVDCETDNGQECTSISVNILCMGED